MSDDTTTNGQRGRVEDEIFICVSKKKGRRVTNLKFQKYLDASVHAILAIFDSDYLEPECHSYVRYITRACRCL